jgi:hypothetical protein
MADTPSHSSLPQKSAAELLACSIAYHDPGAVWAQGSFEITDVSTKPDGTVGRRTILRIDNSHGHVGLDMHIDGHLVSAAFNGDTMSALHLDGNSHFSDGEVKRFQLTADQIRSRRNLFLYLLGLPMKLRDPGTRLDPQVTATQFANRSVNQLRVAYDQSAGSDTWYFYLDPQTCALVGHRYYHNEAAGDGEFAILSGEVIGQGLRLPRTREWHNNRGGEWFITHTVESITALHQAQSVATPREGVPPNPSLQRTSPGRSPGFGR